MIIYTLSLYILSRIRIIQLYPFYFEQDIKHVNSFTYHIYKKKLITFLFIPIYRNEMDVLNFLIIFFLFVFLSLRILKLGVRHCIKSRNLVLVTSQQQPLISSFVIWLCFSLNIITFWYVWCEARKSWLENEPLSNILITF